MCRLRCLLLTARGRCAPNVGATAGGEGCERVRCGRRGLFGRRATESESRISAMPRKVSCKRDMGWPTDLGLSLRRRPSKAPKIPKSSPSPALRLPPRITRTPSKTQPPHALLQAPKRPLLALRLLRLLLSLEASELPLATLLLLLRAGRGSAGEQT